MPKATKAREGVEQAGDQTYLALPLRARISYTHGGAAILSSFTSFVKALAGNF